MQFTIYTIRHETLVLELCLTDYFYIIFLFELKKKDRSPLMKAVAYSLWFKTNEKIFSIIYQIKQSFKTVYFPIILYT